MRWLYAGVVAVMVVFVLVHGLQTFTPVGVPPSIYYLLHINSEGSVPTWYNSVLLFTSAVIAVVGAACASRRERPGWVMLVVLFGYLSMDEMAGIHENFRRFTKFVPQLDVGTYVGSSPGCSSPRSP